MLLVLNWKMYPETYAEALIIFEETKKAATKFAGKVVLAPPALYLRPFVEKYKGRSIAFAAQNIHAEKTGAYTGEISAAQVKSVGATHVLIGHAERRAAGETDVDVRKKVFASLLEGLSPIICVGEKTRDAHSGEHLDAIKNQLNAALGDVPAAEAKRIIIAYEPVWAIGATESMKANEMHEMTIFIRKVLYERYDKVALKIPILYGGAVLDAVHATHMMEESEVNGFLLGRASVDVERLHTLASVLGKL